MRPALLGLFATAVLAAAAAADPPTYKELREKKTAFEKTEAARRTWLLGQFDATARQVGNNRAVPAEVRLKHQEVIIEQKKRYEKDGTLPACDDMLPDLWTYMMAAHKARRPVAQAYTAALNRMAAEADTEAGRALAKEKALYDEGLPGRAAFQPKTTWVGQRGGGANTIDFSFTVGQSDGGAVRGQMWQNQGAAGMRVEGKLDGNYLYVKKVAMLKGANRELEFAGFVMDGRLFMGVGGVAANGRPAGGFVNLRLQK